MPLVSKMIRYPNEREASGFSNTTDGSKGSKITSDEITLKNSIVDIDSFFTNELNLIFIKKTGDLDLTNIPNLDLGVKATKYFEIPTLEFISYGFRTYAFNDQYQTESPLFLKVNYGVRNITRLENNSGATALFAFTLKIELLNQNETIINEFYSGNVYYTDYNAGTTSSNGVIQNTTLESIGIIRSGLLYCNIFPERCVARLYGNAQVNKFNINIPNFDYFKLDGYFHFMIERDENFIKITNMSLFTSASSSNTVTQYSKTPVTIEYYDYIGNKINTGFDCINNPPFLSKNIKNTALPIFNTLNINQFDIVTNNENIYVTYSNLISSKLRQIIDVKINNENIKMYCLPYNVNYNTKYVRDSKLSMLIRID